MLLRLLSAFWKQRASRHDCRDGRQSVCATSESEPFASQTPGIHHRLAFQDGFTKTYASEDGHLDRAGVEFGWMIDPTNRTVNVYRPGQHFQFLLEPKTMVSDTPIHGFELDLAKVWD